MKSRKGFSHQLPALNVLVCSADTVHPSLLRPESRAVSAGRRVCSPSQRPSSIFIAAIIFPVILLIKSASLKTQSREKFH